VHRAPRHASQEVTTPPCPTPQSPRRLERFDQRSDRSLVESGPDDSIYYTPRSGGERQKLLLCSLHYHCHVENVQACNRDVPSGGETCAAPEPGDWIEVHTAYAAEVGTDCDRETLACCAKPPFVVRAYQARVTAGGNPADPLPEPWHPPFAEWSGSNTGPDAQPADCKPLEAAWSFALGCVLRVSQAQLSRFRHADGARALQGGERVSKDLTRVEP
jgi:hypothetical protein